MLLGLGAFAVVTALGVAVLVWVITIALFWYVTLHNLRDGVIPLPPHSRGVLTLVLEAPPTRVLRRRYVYAV